MSKIQTEKDCQKYKAELTEARKLITEMKMRLADVTQNHGRLEIRLDNQDFQGLEPIYKNLLNDIRDIRALCSKPFPA